VAWTNQHLALYHGTDDVSAISIMMRVAPNHHGINLAYCRPLSDFGRGFYTTTYFHQAANWANDRCLVLRNRTPPTSAVATVLQFNMDRNLLALMQTLCFLREDQDYWDFVRHCRSAPVPHRAPGNYDVVLGPVSLWPQTLVIKDCDQISFHTTSALAILPVPAIPTGGQASATNPFLIV
jgi:hypothetical protein